MRRRTTNEDDVMNQAIHGNEQRSEEGIQKFGRM